jgi:archaellum component FlaG (FlaF/FlaG flagellin family)
VANGFEEVKSAGLTALNTVAGQVKSLIEATFALIAVTVNPPALPDVMTAGNPTITWFRNVTEWAKRVTTAAAGVANGFEQIQVGGLQALNNAAGPLKALLDTTFGLVAQAANPPSLPDVTVGSPTLTWFINATEWTKRVASAVAGVANGFESVLTAGLTALNTAAGATLGLIKAAIDTIAAVADPPSIPVVTAGSTLYVFLVSLVGFARRVTEIALTAAAGFTAAAGDGLTALNTATGQALGVLKNTLDLLIAANTEYVIPDNFVDTIKELVRVGMDMAGAFLEIANTFTGIVTPAATQAAQAMDMASKFIKDVYDLGKQMVKEPPSFPANFDDLIKQLVGLAKNIAKTFVDEANTFAVNVGPGAEALLSVFSKLDKFSSGFLKTANTVTGMKDLPADLPTKVLNLVRVAKQMATNYLTEANSFNGTKGEGAVNLEQTIAGFSKLVKDTKTLISQIEDLGTGGIGTHGTSGESLNNALSVFATILRSLESLSESSGTTAGKGFMGAMADAIRDNASQVYDALREVLAGANALLPGGTGGGGGGGGGQGAGATLAGANTGTPTSSGANSGLEAAVAAGVERGMKAAQRANELEQQAKNGGVQQNVTVNLGTAMGLDSTLTLLMNMAKG